MSRPQVQIADGSTLVMRPIEPTDKDALADGFERLSPESRYRRFFSPLSRLSGTDLRYLTEVDHSDHEAVIAFEPKSGQAVGVARYVRSEDPAVAEVAVTVVDDWQGRGVAGALLEQLVRRARAEGIERFLALILAENEAAIELFRQLSAGDPSPRRSADGHIELLIELPAEEELRGSKLGRALKVAAGEGIEINPWRLLKIRVAETAEHRIVPSDEEDPGQSTG